MLDTLDAMRVAALDVGTKRVGVAVSDELRILAHPRAPLDASDRRRLLRRILELARAEAVDRFVVGVPLNADGTVGRGARLACELAEEVATETGLAVELWDERWTTVEATRRLRESGRRARTMRGCVDGASACIILQAWLDAHRESTDGL